MAATRSTGLIRTVVVLPAALLVILSSSPAWAKVSGRLDPSFGTRGKVLTNFTGSDAGDGAYALAVQSDGKIVAAGFHGSTGDFALARYNPNGSLDTTFGTGGTVLTDFGLLGGAIANDVAIQSDGKIVAAGVAGFEFALARYNPNGSLDTSFGTGGEVRTGFGAGSIAVASALAMQPDGKIVATGYSQLQTANGGEDFALARYNSHGHLDTSFGTEGKILTDFSGAGGQAFAVAIQPDGKLVAAGVSTAGPVGQDFVLARYNSDGSLDSTFGTGGEVLTGFSNYFNEAQAVAVQADGKILAAGFSEPTAEPSEDFALVRYNPNGSLDTSFGTGGQVFTGFGAGRTSFALGMAIRSDSKIVAAGYSFSPTIGTSDFALARYNADGTLDSTFGTGGKILTDFTGADDNAFAVAIQSDGKIVAAGLSIASYFAEFALARYRP